VSLAAVVAGAIVFYFWSAFPVAEVSFTGSKKDYYNLLSKGLAKGHLYVDLEVPDAMLKLADPYDPAQNRGIAAHDLSYFRGHYYLYFGITPALLLFLPYHVVSGGAGFPPNLGPPLFCSLGLLAAAMLLWDVRRRCFPRAGFGMTLAALVSVALGSFTLATMRRPDIWETPIASGYACSMAMLWCCWRSLESPGKLGWLIAAGCSFGLAVGSRPTLAPAGVALAVPLAWWWWEGRKTGASWLRPPAGWWRCAAALAGSVTACAAGLALYNYGRFGNPLEFGLHYQCTGIHQGQATLFNAGFLSFNWHVYFLDSAHWTRYFPFLKVAQMPPVPKGYYGTEYVYGMLPSLPVTWLALAALARAAGSRGAEHPAFRIWTAACAAYGVITAAVLLFFNTATARYMVDFVPAFVLLGAVGALAVSDGLAGAHWGWRLGARIALVAMLAASAAFGVLASFQLHGLLRHFRPEAYAALERVCNQPTYWAERLLGGEQGPLQIKLRLPKGRTGKLEPLVVTGWSYEADYVFFYYAGDRHLQVGFDHTAYPLLWSRPVPVDYDRDHVLTVQMGALYPPDSSPLFRRMPPWQVERCRRRYQVALDGEVIVEAPAVFFDASPGEIGIGCNPISDSYGRRFSGQILEMRRIPVKPDRSAAEPTVRPGPLTLSMLLPQTEASPSALGEPLVITGVPGAADAIFVECLKENRIRLGYDHWGWAARWSEPFELVRNVFHSVVVDFGALHPGAGAGEGPLVVKIDGDEVWRTTAPFFPAPPESIAVGRNTTGSTLCGPRFTGAVRAVTDVPDAGR